MRETPIMKNVRAIHGIVQRNKKANYKLGNVYCVLEDTCQRELGIDPMAFQTAVDYAEKKGWL